MRLFGDGQFGIATFQAEAAVRDPDQTHDGAQQRRFSGPVAAGNRQNLAGPDRKADAGKYVASAAMAGQTHGRKPHQAPPRPAPTGQIPAIRPRSFTSAEKTL